MNKIIIYIAIAISLFATKSFAQESFESRAKKIADNIENITKSEKEALKNEIELVNAQLDKKEITLDQALSKKQELAGIRAKNIETKVAAEQQKLNDLIKEKVDGKIVEVNPPHKQRSYRSIFKESTGSNREKYAQKQDSLANFRRTTMQLVFAMGLNNVLTNKSLANSDFRYFGSHFYEFGLTLNSRLTKDIGLLHLKYGFSAVWNNLRPTDDRAFEVTGNQTNLQTSAVKLEDSRFRNVYVTFPLHLEFDFSKPYIHNSSPVRESHNSYRFGLGGFIGFNADSKQFSEVSSNNYDSSIETKGDFNTSNFIYGLSAYVGHQATSLYVKYDLNPLFRNNLVKQNNISLGIRWDLN